MRVLVTALGSMSAPFVVSAVQEMGLEVVGIDMYPRAWVAAAEQVQFFSQMPPLAEAEAYEHALIKLCLQHDVKLVLPLTDIEVDFLSARAAIFASQGIRIAVSQPDAVQLMRNKLALHDKFKDCSSLTAIPSYQREHYLQQCNTFPCIAKPIDGRSSEGQLIVQSAEEFSHVKPASDRYIYQPLIHGAVLVADILKSGTHKPIFIARRELTRTKNGAGLAVQILDEQQALQDCIEAFTDEVEFEGCINVEFLQPPDGRPMLMDVNPRFSAGVAFSNLAGYNFVRNHVAHFLSWAIEPLCEIKHNAIYTRKYIEVAVQS